jgi:predicted RNase H-like nuclease (RuvC/YqgF family)
MEELRMPDNNDVPIETICKWQRREINKLNQIIIQKKKVIERLRHNITMLLKSPEIRLQIAKDLILRERAQEVSRLQRELCRVRESDRNLLQKLIDYKLKEKDGEQGIQNVD